MITYTIGRSDDNDIVIDDHNISNRHAIIKHYEGNRLVIEDQSSVNGVWVNGRRVETCLVDQKNKIELGSNVFNFERAFRFYDGIILGVRPHNDWTDKFEELKTIEEDGDKKIEQINKSANKNMIYFRIMIVFIPVLYILKEVPFVKEYAGQNLIIMLVVLFGLVATYFYSKGLSGSSMKTKLIKDANAVYRTKFVCPSCKEYISDNLAYMAMKKVYNCKYCKAKLYEERAKF